MKPIEKDSFNNCPNELTYEKLKTFKGFENVTEAQAKKEIETIKRLAKILYYLYMHEERNEQNKNSDYENDRDSEQFGA